MVVVFFYETMRKTLKSAGFMLPSAEFPCIWRDTEQPYLWILVWVDNLFLNPKPVVHDRRVASLRAVLRTAFPNGVTSTDPALKRHHILGCILEIPRPGYFVLHQRPFLEGVLRRASMDDCSPVDTPVAAGFKWTQADSEVAPGSEPSMDDQARTYRSVVMSTNYALEWTRPDFSFVQSKLAKYMHRPGPRHFAALKRFLRYIKGTLEKGVVFDFCSATVPRPFVYCFFDAAHADDLDTRRSTIAYVLFWAGVPILYKTKLHTFVTTSTNHSELVAAAFAARAAKRLWVLFSCLGFEDEVSPIDLFTDSAGCLYVSRGEGTSTALRHVELADFFARELIRRGIVTMTHVRTGRMVADVLTKALPVGKFRELRAFLVGTLVFFFSF